jgi:hypothetical protein
MVGSEVNRYVCDGLMYFIYVFFYKFIIKKKDKKTS